MSRKIKVLLNLGNGWPPYREDEVVEIDETDPQAVEMANRLVSRGLATEVASRPQATMKVQADASREAAATAELPAAPADVRSGKKRGVD